MNIVRLLNTMREYQLRENLIRSLKTQIEEKKQLNAEVQSMIEKVKTTVQASLQSLQEIPHEVVESSSLSEEIQKQSSGCMCAL